MVPAIAHAGATRRLPSIAFGRRPHALAPRDILSIAKSSPGTHRCTPTGWTATNTTVFRQVLGPFLMASALALHEADFEYGSAKWP